MYSYAHAVAIIMLHHIYSAVMYTRMHVRVLASYSDSIGIVVADSVCFPNCETSDM